MLARSLPHAAHYCVHSHVGRKSPREICGRHRRYRRIQIPTTFLRICMHSSSRVSPQEEVVFHFFSYRRKKVHVEGIINSNYTWKGSSISAATDSPEELAAMLYYLTAVFYNLYNPLAFVIKMNCNKVNLKKKKQQKNI